MGKNFQMKIENLETVKKIFNIFGYIKLKTFHMQKNY